MTTVLNVNFYEIDIDVEGRGRVRFLAPVVEKRVVVSVAAGLATNLAALPDSVRHGILRLVSHYHIYRDRADELGPPAIVCAGWPRLWRRRCRFRLWLRRAC